MTSDKRDTVSALAPGKLRRRLVLGLLLLNLCVGALAAYSLYRDYQQHQRRMTLTTQSLAAVLQHQVGALFERVNLLLQTTGDGIEDLLAAGRGEDRRIDAFLKDQVGHVPEVASLRMIDARGVVRHGRGVASSHALDASGREHFARQRDDPNAGLVIAKPTLSRISREWVIPVSRRLSLPDGSFAGVVYASIPTKYFTSLFAALPVGEQGLVTLHNLDSVVLARHPALAAGGEPHGQVMVSQETRAFLASGLASTSYRAVSPVDGVERMLAVRRVPSYPLYVLVGQSPQEYLDDWWKNLFETLGLVALFSLTSTALAALLYRAWRRQWAGSRELQKSEQLWAFALESGGYCVWDWDLGAGRVQLSMRGKQLFGYADDQIGDDIVAWARLVHPEDAEQVRADLRTYLRGGVPEVPTEYRVRAGDGQWRWIQSRGMVVNRDVRGRVLRMIGTHTDVTERRTREEALRRAAIVFDIADEGVVFTDAYNRIIAVNPAFGAITGYAAEDVLGRNPSMLSARTHPKAFYDEMWGTLLRTGSWSGEVLNRKKSGEIFVEWLSIKRLLDQHGQVLNHVAVFSDITARKAAEERMQHLALHDVLTDLPNRALLSERAAQAILRAQRERSRVGLLFFDLDNFKPVNDAHGHEVGDLLLKAVASRISDCVRASDTVARLGGDEFVVLLPSLESQADALLVAEKIRAALNQPFDVAGRIIDISTSMGLALFPEHGQDQDTLTRHADAAMYRAKQSGRNRVVVYAEGM